MGQTEFNDAVRGIAPQRRTPPARPVEPLVQYPPEDGGAGVPMCLAGAIGVALALGAYFMGWLK